MWGNPLRQSIRQQLKAAFMKSEIVTLRSLFSRFLSWRWKSGYLEASKENCSCRFFVCFQAHSEKDSHKKTTNGIILCLNRNSFVLIQHWCCKLGVPVFLIINTSVRICVWIMLNSFCLINQKWYSKQGSLIREKYSLEIWCRKHRAWLSDSCGAPCSYTHVLDEKCTRAWKLSCNLSQKWLFCTDTKVLLKPDNIMNGTNFSASKYS